jgi:cytosine permease
MSYAGADGKGAMSMGVGLTIVLTLFVDAGTVTADFNRWAKDLKGSLVLPSAPSRSPIWSPCW